MNPDIPTYQPLKKPEDPVAKSIAKPTAFAKPGVMTRAKGKGTRFRPLVAKNPRPRKRKKDARYVTYY